jgi:NAD(P)-dependent dehydrogenase (short-subunit alcohol dehydrogenase family)
MTTFVRNLLQGKAAFVAGGTSGINLGIASALAAYGAAVAVLSRKQEKVDAAVQQLSSAGATAIGFAADVREYGSVERALAGAAESLGALDIVVSGAAGNFLAPAAELSANGFKAVVDIDLLGTFNVLRAAYGVLRKPGASIINISAPQSTEAYWGQAHVSAAKAGIDMLTRSLAVEWGPEGVRVNAIVPGPIVGTEGMARLAPDMATRTSWENANPLRRFGTPADIANAALFLCSDAASYVNGAILYCDGGQVLSGGRDYRETWAAMQRKG